MLNRYYEQELGHLRGLATEFAARNPALAPMLGANSAGDPDVERLLEGVAFLTSLMRRRLDDDFPEFIQTLAQLLFPHTLRPLPCMTIMQYEPRAALEGPVLIPAGTEFASVPVDGLRTLFRASFPVTVEPLELLAARWEGGGTQARSLRLEFNFTGVAPKDWKGERLRLFLGDSQADAARLFLLLQRYVREVRVGTEGGPLTILPASSIEAAGLRPDLELLPWPAGAHPAWRVLYEYFALPEKLLFLDITGFPRWQSRGPGTRFSVQFVFNQIPDWAPNIGESSFILNATPAVNLFTQDAHPIRVDHRQPEYRIHPTDRNGSTEGIFSVDQVRARMADGTEYECHPFSAFAEGDEASYNLRIHPSALTQDYDHYLSLPYAKGTTPETQTLSIRVTCTHGNLPESLRLGDICEPTDNSPARIGFRNILGVTAHSPPVVDNALLWRVLSHLNANHLALAKEGRLRDLLALYVPPRQFDAHRHAAAQRSLESIENVQVDTRRRIVRGMPVEGSEVRIECRGDHFPGPGNLFLFGTVLDEFLAGTTALNTFSALTLVDTVNGETLTWPAKIGRARLL
ncbi:type VI secretion system baseplate subunit TssF [Paralcaligenes sp. KSB-10]|uniref:type VI secretion system baseplate subunit TssF n=1 Tax=Paralcaligenes sp. KSB-10 TaxID=2901142 RepID=UPI001E3AD6A7|nr:type VI secretion system baseplate subunit TssF [Paralcaligenes sp. KSB-10]UHL65672.1 type VI secretion system baseplate subunit TssF [Paralcaligenes sp. KSB-10]